MTLWTKIVRGISSESATQAITTDSDLSGSSVGPMQSTSDTGIEKCSWFWLLICNFADFIGLLTNRGGVGIGARFARPVMSDFSSMIGLIGFTEMW